MSASSGAGSSTQPFSEGHVEQRLLAATSEGPEAQGEALSAGPEADLLSGVDRLTTNLAALHVDTHFPPNTRLIIYDTRAQEADVEVWKLKQRSAWGPQAKCDPLNVDGVDMLLLRQTSSDVGHHLLLSSSAANGKVECRLQIVYDAFSEQLLVVNASSRPISVAPHHVDGVPSGPSRILPNASTPLRPGVYAVDVTPSTPPVLFCILPRGPYSVSTDSPGSTGVLPLPVQDQPGSKGKRPAPLDKQGERETAGPSKRKGRAISEAHEPDPEENSTNALVFQLNPLLALEHNSLQNPFLGLEPGTVVHIPGTAGDDSYTLTRGRDIAQTKSARVFLAKHSNLDGEAKVVVVKVLKQDRRGQHELAKLWLRETEAHARVGHDSLPTVCRFYASDARFLAIYMQHIAGSSLRSPVWCQPQTNLFSGTVHDAHRFLHDIAAALAYIHGQGIQHNDLKPDNIVISETAAERHAVLIDFGIGTMVGTRSTGAGSPWYIPPEYLASGDRTPLGDVWALGVVGLFLRRLTPLPEAVGAGWTISHLHMAETTVQREEATKSMSRWISRVYEARKGLGSTEEPFPADALDRVIQRMLEPEAEKRPQAVAVTCMLSDSWKENNEQLNGP